METINQCLEQSATAAELRSVARLVESGTYAPEELVEIFLEDERPLKLKAIRVVDELSQSGKLDLRPWLPLLLEVWQRERMHPGIHRAVLNILRLQGIPEDEEGMVMSTAFELLSGPSTPVAVTVLAIKVLRGLCKKYPEIRQELQLRIEDALEHTKSPALHLAARDFAGN